MANFRPFIQARNCAASKCSTGSNSSKSSPTSWAKAVSDSVLSAVWKSVAAASSVLKPVTATAFKGNHSESHKFVEQTDNHLGNFLDKNSEREKSSNADTSADIQQSSSGLEEMFLEWIASNPVGDENEVKKASPTRKTLISKASLEQRSRSLVKSLNCATSPASQTLRLEEICKHLLTYPGEKSVMIKEGLLRTALWMRQQSIDEKVLMQVRVALSLLGYHNPPAGNGIRILSIDGGGTRGIMAIEILRQLEARTNRKVYQLFDYICGVSSGAILTLLLGGLRMSVNECEMLYRKLSMEVFSQSPFWGTGSLLWSHAYYDTTLWLSTLKNVFNEKLLIDSMKEEHTPKLGAVSAVMNLPALQAFVFRNYDFPVQVQSQYLGSCNKKMWEAVRASGAAPGYFQEYCLDEFLHQDGGIMINNPAALAIHEARLLWPSEHIQCVVSLGSGRYTPATKSHFTSTSWRTKIMKVIDSATDTEGVHVTLNDLLSSHTYFRFNPYLTEFLSLDEKRPEKLEQLKTDAQMYLRRNEYKFGDAVNILSQKRTVSKKHHARCGSWPFVLCAQVLYLENRGYSANSA